MENMTPEDIKKHLAIWKDEEDLGKSIINQLDGKILECQQYIKHLRKLRKVERWKLKYAIRARKALKWYLDRIQLAPLIDTFIGETFDVLIKWVHKALYSKK